MANTNATDVSSFDSAPFVNFITRLGFALFTSPSDYVWSKRQQPPRRRVFTAKLNTAFTLPVYLQRSDTGEGLVAGSLYSISLKKSGGSFSTITPTVTERANGSYDLALTSSHTDTLGVAEIQIFTRPSSLLAPIYINVVAFDQQDSLGLGLRALTVPTGACVANGSNTALTFKTNLTSSVTDAFKNAFLIWTSGTLINQVSKIQAYDSSTKFITVIVAYSTAPTGGDTFDIINR